MDEILHGKTIYGFGDSLVYGHELGTGMLDQLAADHEMIYTKYAVNGATVIPGLAEKRGDTACMVPDVAQQIQDASPECPDYICFDGLMNDCYMDVARNMPGRLTESFDGGYDITTYAGAFENICLLLRKKYQNSRVVYVSVHRTASRQMKAQEILHALSCDACRKWAIPVADIFQQGGINTAIAGMRYAYSYDRKDKLTGGNGTHLNAEGYRRWYTPLIRTKLMEIS